MTDGRARDLRFPARVLAAAVALVLLAGPLALGGLAQQTYQNQLGAALETLPGGWVIFEHYDRGWFSSMATAELAFQPGQSDLGRPPIHLRLASRVDHGPLHWLLPRLPPVLTRIETRVELISPASSLAPLEIQTDVDLSGASHSSLHLPASESAGGTRAYAILNEPLDGTLEVARDGELRAEILIPRLELVGPAGPVARVSGLHLTVDLSPTADGLYEGDAALSVGSAGLGSGPGATGVKDLKLELRHTEDPADAALDLALDLHAAGLALAGQTYGDTHLRLSAAGWDGLAVAELAEGLRAIASGSVSGPMRGMVGAALVARLLPRLAASQPSLGLEGLRMESDQGSIEARLMLGISASPESPESPGSPASGVAPLADPIELLSRLTGDGEIALPRAIVIGWLDETNRGTPEGAPGSSPDERIRRWIDGGWVSEQEGRIASALRIADGLLTVNGRTFPLLRPPAPGRL